jgi:tRNA-2-methylthio-N6-dimethylallyladenosine synthase
MKYYLKVFGCQMNIADGERIETVMNDLEYEKASKIEDADLIIAVACSVRQSAIDRVFGLATKFKNPKAKTILTGCLLKDDIVKFKKKFDYILNIRELNKWNEILTKEKHSYPKNYLNICPCRNNSFIAYIPISNGCENFCTYCAVPYTRGPLKCRKVKDIIKEIKDALKNGAKEVWLLGQNVNDYDDNGNDFADLIKEVNDVKGDFWIRFTSPHPKNFSNKLIKTLAKSEKFKPYINLPIQSGSDTVLKRMNRPYSYAKYKKLLDDIREAFNGDITVTTDVIVGFSDETKKEFNETKKAFKECNFDMAYVSQYSTRPGTFATLKMHDNIPKQEKKEREKVLTEIIKKQNKKKNKTFVGKILNVLVIDKKTGYYLGKSEEYKTVKFKSKENLLGEFVRVKITKALDLGLEGEHETR